MENGGITEQMSRARREYRSDRIDRSDYESWKFEKNEIRFVGVKNIC